MSSPAISLSGIWFDGTRPVGVPATLVAGRTGATLRTTSHSRDYSTDRLQVSPRTGVADRFILFPDGGQLQCADGPEIDALPQESRGEGLIAWLESRVVVALAGIALVFAMVGTGYFYGLPWASEKIADHIPMETEARLGAGSLDWLDDRRWFEPSKLSKKKRTVILKGFDQLRAGLPIRRYLHLKFRNSAVIGPNAFALPGGTIIITDQMVNKTRNLEEVEAVLSHEIGHVVHRHAVRSLMQNSAVAVLVTAITGDAATLSTVVAGVPTVLAQTRYSRRFETEADDYGFALLKKRGQSPLAFAHLMERLAKNRGGKKERFSFLSSHPVTAERIRRAREAAKRK
jgi:Zn-dependent protease with chaperone function